MSSNDDEQTNGGSIYQLYDFVIADVYSSESAVLECIIPSCRHTCCCCHSNLCQWVSIPKIVLSESSCFHCQLFECDSCCDGVVPITVPIPAIISLLPSFHLYWFHPICWNHESFCVLSFDETDKPMNTSHLLLRSLITTRYCQQCRKNLIVTFFIYAEEKLAQSEPFQELLHCLPATRVVVIQIHQRTTPLLKLVMEENEM